MRPIVTVDGNEAAAHSAYLTNEVIAIYPITPASPMGEFADEWADSGRKNMFDGVPQVTEMQSEGGAAGAVHGSLQAGALTTTFTASQGLLLMLPNMFKIAGELTATVFHIAARSVATHALSIFGDHSDVMAVRSSGWGMLCSGSIQEIQDLAMIAQMATLEARVPLLHFFDGFRSSHEINKIEQLTVEDARALIDMDTVYAHRERALSPDHPVLRGSAQNPDVFFQAREACSPYYDRCPQIVQKAMDRFAKRLGRSYHLFDYVGAPDAERVVVLMGSGTGAAQEAVEALTAKGEKVGAIFVRLFRPFSNEALVEALPKTTKAVAVLDRTKEPGATGEPLYQDVLTALNESWKASLPRVIGGRYGLSSKEFTPAMVKAVLDELSKSKPKNHFTVGIVDDVSNSSLDYDPGFTTEDPQVTRALFYGLGADGTVGATKNTVKIIGENTPLNAQGYFVYDSRKSGAVTCSHLRLGPKPIRGTYLIRQASFVACHQFHFLERMDVLKSAEEGATFLLNSPYGADEVWQHLPRETQRQIIDKKLKLFVIDGDKVAKDAGLGTRINTIMQTCFFHLSGVLPQKEAIAQIKEAIEKTYKKQGEAVLRKNYAAVSASVEALSEVKVPGDVRGDTRRLEFASDGAPDFVKEVTATIIAGRGDELPVSAMPHDGTFPVGTTKWEKRSIAREIPIWDKDICTRCGICAVACPHAAIRMKVYDQALLEKAPAGFAALDFKDKTRPGTMMTIQVAPEDCTGCGVCVDVCPANNKKVEGRKAINMEPKPEHLDQARQSFEFFLSLPEGDPVDVKLDTVKGSQQLEPLFEFSGACAGCGETPYVKLVTQLFGDRMLVANATGCSSIYGGNLPTTPWTTNRAGRGPAWSNSLFEDNAEFGLGMRLAVDQQRSIARALVTGLALDIGEDLVDGLLGEDQTSSKQRERVEQLKKKLEGIEKPEARQLFTLADALVDRSVWIIGGDGWAYDIGFGGLDHVFACGRNVNIMVLDTEVYSNTGGQASKATPRGAVAKFAAGGKPLGKKDLGMIAVSYGDVYVAQVAMGANQRQTIRALLEAEAYPGVSLVICYSPCIAHGVDLSTSQSHMKDAVKSGFWPLYRYTPGDPSGSPFTLDSKKPTMPFREYAAMEGRWAQLMRARPEHADALITLGQQDIDNRWRRYEQLAKMGSQ